MFNFKFQASLTGKELAQNTFYMIYAKHGTNPLLTRAEAVVKTNCGGVDRR